MLYCSRSNFSESMITLLAHGADVNRTDKDGYNALALSVIHRSFDALDVLLRCRRYRRASGLALVYACRFGREDIVVQLLHFCGGKYYFLSIFTISAISHTHCR